MVALIGEVPRKMSQKHTHQSMRALDMLEPITKKTIAIHVEDQSAEVMLEAFRSANFYPKGAVVVSVPQDVASLDSKILPFQPEAFRSPLFGPGNSEQMEGLKRMLESAKLPVLLLGMRASAPKVVYAIRRFLHACPIPVVETFQAAGAVPRDLVHLFYGRIGLFRNQPGDRLLARSDCILAVGYDPFEYDASNWNPLGKLPVVHVDYQTCSYDFHYQPRLELLGSIAENFELLNRTVTANPAESTQGYLKDLMDEFTAWKSTESAARKGKPVQPLHFVRKLQELLDARDEKDGGDTQVVTDVGTVYIYMMRHFYAYEPRMLLSSNGQQTLGVGLPWAIAANLVQDPPCSRRVVSVSGDGGFMVRSSAPAPPPCTLISPNWVKHAADVMPQFSSQELATAVQQGCKITHFIWNDSAYNMVQFQEEMKYGRSSGVALGGIDFVKYAEAFGAKGLKVREEGEMEAVMREALSGHEGVVVVDVAIDYQQAQELAGHVIPEEWS